MNKLDNKYKQLWPNASRNTDPETSHKAERTHTLGKRAERARQVLRLVDRFPNRTSGELSAEWYELSQNKYDFEYTEGIRICAETPHKRLPDLEQMGLVERGATRKCSDSGMECVTWHATAAGIVEANKDE